MTKPRRKPYRIEILALFAIKKQRIARKSVRFGEPEDDNPFFKRVIYLPQGLPWGFFYALPNKALTTKHKYNSSPFFNMRLQSLAGSVILELSPPQ